MKKVKGKVAGIIALLVLVLVYCLASIVIIDSGTSGVVSTLGRVSENTLKEGLHIVPAGFNKVTKINNKVQKVDLQAASTSKDLQNVKSSVSVNFHVLPEKSAAIYVTVGAAYAETILKPAIQESMKAVMAQYSAEELITERSSVGKNIEDNIKKKMPDYGLAIDEFNITDFDFSEEYNAAIEQKQIAEQNRLRSETEALQKKVEAEGEATATTIRAEAQAEANRKLSESLNDDVIKYKTLEKWNGEYPDTVVGDTSSVVVGLGN